MSNTGDKTVENDGSATSISVIDDIGILSGEMCDFVLYLQAPSATDSFHTCSWQGAHYVADDSKVVSVMGAGGYTDDMLAITGLRFFSSSGTIASGQYDLYGLAT